MVSELCDDATCRGLSSVSLFALSQPNQDVILAVILFAGLRTSIYDTMLTYARRKLIRSSGEYMVLLVSGVALVRLLYRPCTVPCV